MTESGGSNGADRFDQWRAHREDEQNSDAVVPTLPRRARAVPFDESPVFERAVLEPLTHEPARDDFAPAHARTFPAPTRGSHRGEPPTVAAPPSGLGSALPPVAESASVVEPAHVVEPAPVEEPVAERPDAVDEAPSTAATDVLPLAVEPPAAPQPERPTVAEAASADVPHKTRRTTFDDPARNTVIFKPRRATRTTLTSVLIVWVVASICSVIAAWHQPSQPTIGISVAIIALTAVTWVVRGGTSVARLTVRAGTLEIRKAGARASFSLSDSYQIIEVVGRPGSMGWKVLFRRKDHEPYVVDSSLVDPKEFMRVLTYYRPELER